MDYFNPTAGTASLSLARFPATNKTGKIGTLLVNPGGPGGSGVLFLYRAGKRLNDLLGGKYDIVGVFYLRQDQELIADAGELGPSRNQWYNVSIIFAKAVMKGNVLQDHGWNASHLRPYRISREPIRMKRFFQTCAIYQTRLTLLHTRPDLN